MRRARLEQSVSHRGQRVEERRGEYVEEFGVAEPEHNVPTTDVLEAKRPPFELPPHLVGDADLRAVRALPGLDVRDFHAWLVEAAPHRRFHRSAPSRSTACTPFASLTSCVTCRSTAT